jgi:branched-chain amino acid transport system ATP-binding protein
VLRIEDLHVYYGNIHALKGVSLEVEEGEIVTLVGANGAGKSTTMRAVAGLEPARSGRVLYRGEPIQELPTPERVGRGLVLCPEGRQIFANLSVEENLRVGGYLRKDKKAVSREIDDIYQMFPVLGERRRQRGGTLSGGEQQMLAVGRSLVSAPRLLALDEPSLGLAPLIVKRIFDALATLNRERGLTILLVEQNAQQALKLADRGYVLEIGEVLLSGPASELLEDPRVQEAYLGL